MTLETTDSGRAKPQPPLPPVKKWDSEAALKRIEAISINARSTWFGLLALLTFVLVTLLGVQHIDFFGYGRATQLPLVNVSVPTERFFIAAPVLVAAVYAYFHFYLMKLWDELGQAEPEIDGRPLGDLVFPWLVVDGALLLRTDNAASRRALSRVSAFTSLTLTWLFGLGVLAYGLWQSLPAHSAYMSLLNCVALLFAGWVGVTSYIVMRRRLKHRMFGPNTERVWNGWRGIVGALLCIAAMLAAWERSTNGASQFASDMWLTGAAKKAEAADETGDLTRNRHLAITSLIPIAPIDLAHAQLAEKPADWLDKSAAERDFRKRWCSRQGLAWAMCVKEPDDHQTKARRAWCSASSRRANGTKGAQRLPPEACQRYFTDQNTDFQTEWEGRRKEYLSVLKKPILRDRNLSGANLRNAFLTDVDLEGAALVGADLRQARMEGANLKWARLERAIFFKARLEGADLSGARLEGADLNRARLEGANLFAAQLRWATLNKARLGGAVLHRAWLVGADLSEARLEGADLSEAELEGANLSKARLEGANLIEAHLQATNFNNATIGASVLNSADFLGAQSLTQSMLQDAVGDQDTVLPIVDGTPLFVWSCWEEPPANFEALIEMQSPWDRSWRREQWLCGPEGRKKTGRSADP